MKHYKLLKDLPTFKAGEKFHINQNGSLVADKSGVVAYARSTLDKFPNILEDWLEEIPEGEPWVPAKGEKYWYVCSYGGSGNTTWDGMAIDFGALKLSNCFKTEEEAKKAVRWLEARKVLMDDTKGFKPNWKDVEGPKYYVYCGHVLGFFSIGETFRCQLGEIHFSSKEDAEKSIQKHRDEWLTYFGVEEGDV